MIWAALLIPLAAIVLVAIKFPKRMNIIEYGVLLVVPIVCIAVGKGCSVYSQTKDTEYWNTYAVKCLYEERWKEEWREKHTETTTDSKGKTHTRTYWTTETENHPECWTITDNMGGKFSVGRQTFDHMCKLWGNRTFKEMDRRHTSPNRMETSHKILIDGDGYETVYDKLFEHTIPICKQHTYENRIQCSKSVFNFRDVPPDVVSTYKLFSYPNENLYSFNPILGHENAEASKLLSFHNAHNGATRQIHMMLLVFNGQPQEAALFQEAYWKGGNKNEFVVCVGLKGNAIDWTYVISWTDKQELKIKAARDIKEMREFDAVKVAKYMGENIPKQFVRKQFADFSYIKVRPTMKAIIITFIITLVVTGGLTTYSVMNQHDFGTVLNRRRNRYGRF